MKTGIWTSSRKRTSGCLIDRYWEQYGKKKRSSNRERSILEGIRRELGSLFVREVDGSAIDRWYRRLTDVGDLALGTAARHFNVMHHMMGKAATLVQGNRD